MFDIKVNDGDGLEAITQYLREIREMLTDAPDNAQLLAIPRVYPPGKSGTATNPEILKYLADSGRDFFGQYSKPKELTDRMVAAFEHQLEKQLKFKEKKAAKKIHINGNQIATTCLRATLKEMMAYVIDAIELQMTVSGLAPRPLSEDYAYAKEKLFGFIDPIGVATGQLLDNISNGSIQITKRKSGVRSLLEQITE